MRKIISSFAAIGISVASSLLAVNAFAQSDQPVKIGVSLFQQQSKRFVYEAGLMEKLAKANGDDIIVNFGNNSAATQANQIETMLLRGIKVLIVVPLEPKALAPLIARARKQGVKVITYDSSMTAGQADYGVQRDNAAAGKQSVDAALAASPEGKYAIIRGDISTPIAVELGTHFDDVKSVPGVQVVYDQSVPGWNADTAQKYAEAAVQRDPDLKAVIAMWDNASVATVQALKAAGKKPGDVFVTGNNGDAVNLKLIQEGWQGQTTWTSIDQMAKDAMAAAHAFGTGKEPPKADKVVDGIPYKYARTFSITKDSLCEYITKVAPEGWLSPADIKEIGNGKNPCD